MIRSKKEARLLSGETLAYLGDSVIELCVRSYLVERGIAQSGDLNRASLAFVSATAQAEAVRRILPILSEDELGVYRRAHNKGHIQNVPRSATVGQYRAATGMEALFGYLYLAGELSRIRELFLVGYPETEGAEPIGFSVDRPVPTE
ncbi:MAG: ribonuclease III [Clostridia bacterium]|nr:ribonuclease III [Clostridia bacterium]